MTDYDSRSTWDSGLDAGSTPARSTFLLLYLIFSYKTDILLHVPVEPDLIYMLNSILSHFVL